MKKGITIKHITLALGIVVALLAAIMFLVNDSLPFESRHAISLPSFGMPKSVPALIQTIGSILF
ncbi:MAG TPA: hypothetical protein VGD65_14575 [Chryseosolibacter sp.]